MKLIFDQIYSLNNYLFGLRVPCCKTLYTPTIAEVVECRLTLSTAVRVVAGSILAEGMFSEKYLWLELSRVQIHGYQERPTKSQSVGMTIKVCTSIAANHLR